MSRRRRRNSRRRKSSSCSKQSICPYNFPKHARTPSDDVGLRDEHAEKGEADSLHKENSLCKSDAEEEKEEDTETPCAKKRLRRDSAVGCFNSNARRQADISSDGTTSEGDQGVRITTSVTINNLEQNTSQIVFQRSHSSSAVGLGNSTIAITTTKLEGIHANMKIEIRELLQVDNSDYKTTFVLQGQKAKDTEASSENQQYGFQIPNNESFTFSYPWSQRTNQNDSKTEKPFENMSCVFSVVEMSNEGADTSRSSVPTMCHSEDTACYKSCCQDHCDGYSHFSHYDTDFTLVDGSSSLSTLSDVWPLQKKSSLTHSFSSNTQLDILPPDEFADRESDDDVDDLTEDVAMCHIGSSFDDINDLGESASVMMFEASSSKRESTCYMSVNGGRSDDTTNASFDPESELETEELFEWPDTPMSRSSFTKNFIYRHKQKACMRNNSIAILENNTSPAGYLRMSKKRRKTFPAVMDQSGDHQDMPMCRESFSSGALSPFFTQSLPHEAELSGRFYQEDDLFSPHCSESRKSSKGSNLSSSPVRHHNIFSPKHYACDPGTANLFFGSDNDAGACDRGAQELSVVEESDPESVVWHPQEHSEITESGFDEELVDMESNTEGLSPIRSVPLKDPFIHITPPSPRSSRDSNINSGYNAEHTKPESDPEPYTRETKSDPEPQTQRKESAGDIQPKSRKSSVTTVMIVGSEQRILHSHSPDSATLERSHREISSTVSETPCLLPIVDTEQMEEDGTGETVREGQLTPLRALVSESSTSIQSLSPVPFEVTDLQSDSNHSLRSANTSQDIETKDEAATDNHVEKCSKAKSKNAQSFHNSRRAMMQPDTARRHSSSKIPEIKELLKLPADSTHKDPEEAPDHWARRRKLFKESRNRSSAGGSSITSNITDESDTMFSEDIRPVDVSMRDIEDRGFYTETFHCASWIYRGDDVSPSESPRCLSKRPKSVTIRERTVKITKGFGEYPWGFRIQFSKPIVVTEVDTNGAAEEAGLLVGDYVLAVNGTDVTSVPHSEAADLARQGPDLLTMIIGSDISRCPNTPRPACRGYLHKRTQSSLIKGWRKRWFVLRHDRCLYYYRHKRDEGKSQALSKLKLEGAEVEADTSLGKPFVFRCSPVSAGRVFYFCATSNQEMKRWLEAMSQAVQPVPQNHVWVDVTRHNSSMPPLAVKSPECLGMLHQLDRTKDVWVQNYCILKDGCLYFYASIRSTSALGGIYLHGYSVREQPLGAKRSTIELKPPSEECKTFHLCAENPTENKRWILALRASISKWVPLHRAIQDYMSKPPEVTRM